MLKSKSSLPHELSNMEHPQHDRHLSTSDSRNSSPSENAASPFAKSPWSTHMVSQAPSFDETSPYMLVRAHRP